MKTTTREMILVAEFAAILAALSQLTFPLGPIPLTMQTFAVGLTATILGKRLGTYSVFIYLLLGLIGLPVFAEFSSGFHVLFGPTGGYLVGFIFNALVTGWLLEKNPVSHAWGLAANLAGAFCTLLFGTLWLKISGDLTFATAALSGFVPFILPGIIKAAAASILGITLNRRLPFLKKLAYRSQV